MISGMADEGGWRCPLCRASAASAAEHLRAEHGIGAATEDRFGLREAARPRPVPRRRPSLTAGARPIRHRSPTTDAETAPPPKTPPLPPDAAVLRLVCETLDGGDLAGLQVRLAELAGVDSVAIDLYERTIDLFLDRRRAAPPHLVALASERVGLPVVVAELHRAPASGAWLGDETFLLVVA